MEAILSSRHDTNNVNITMRMLELLKIPKEGNYVEKLLFKFLQEISSEEANFHKRRKIPQQQISKTLFFQPSNLR